MRVDPWPRIAVDGKLENAEREWLLTNGAGAYSMSTVALMHTRRYHGLLVAALHPPLQRYVILSHADTSLEVGSRIYRLSTHQFPNTAPTPGYRLLRRFAQDPLPRWTYRLGKGELERELTLVRGENTLVIAYKWSGPAPAVLSTRPLMPMRPFHELSHEHGAVMQRVNLRPGAVEIHPVPELPQVVFGHPGVFVGSPDWWRRFEYAEDLQRGAHFQEDVWTPGTFEVELEPGGVQYFVVALDQLPETPAAELMEAARRHWQRLDPGTDHSLTTRSLSVAAGHFRVDACDRPGVISGYPWLSVGTRDTLVSLPGLYLAKGDVDGAKRVLETITGLQNRDGFLARGIVEDGTAHGKSCVDGTLWLFEVARQLVGKLGMGDTFIAERLYPVLTRIFERIAGAKREPAWLADDGLLAGAEPNTALTWMDSRAHGELVTPRHGCPVEFQGLWYSGTQTLGALAAEYGNHELKDRVNAASERLELAFRQRFWCEATRYPYDFLPVDGVSSSDADLWDAIRPNAVLALSVAPKLFEPWQAKAIIETARDHLLTPRGLRTLSPHHPRYVGHFEGPMAARRAAYHQGVAWVYLLGAFARAAMAVDPNDFELQMDIHDVVEQATQGAPLVGNVAQVASGDTPHQPGGCPAQAWSVAELLRTLVVDLHL